LIVTVAPKALAEAVASVSKVTVASKDLPILAGVLLTADGSGTLTVSGTDGLRSAAVSVPAQVEEPGAAVVSARTLGQVAKSLSGGACRLTGARASVKVSCGRSRFSLAALPASDFPAFPEVSPESSVELPCEVLSDLVGRVRRFASKDLTHPILCAMSLTVAGGRLTLKATDSYRLVVASAAIGDDGASFSALLPADALPEALAMAAGSDTVSVGQGAGQWVVRWRGGSYVCRLVEGCYPEVESLFPKTATCSVGLPMKATLDALSRVALVATDNPKVRLDIGAADGEVAFSACSGEVGDAADSVDCAVEGTPLSIGLNHRYLEDALGAFSGREAVTMVLSGEMRPAVFTAPGTPEVRCLVMPTRL
jgi:DNA polymerase-3 subunit beta